MIINKNMWKMALLLPLFMACSEDNDTNSTVSQFQTWSPVLDSNTPAVVADEVDGDTYTFTFFTDAKQFMDASLVVGVGASSTAVEGVDFELSTHEIDLLAFEGNDGFDVSIELLQDFVAGEDDETIYLTFTTDLPTGAVSSEVLALTIRDSDVASADFIDFSLTWDFDNDEMLEFVGAESICDVINDLDFGVYADGLFPYNGTNDLLHYQMSSGACPAEVGTIDMNEMVDGTAYVFWIIFYGGVDYGDLGTMTSTLEFNRPGTTLSGALTTSGWNSADGFNYLTPYYMVKEGDVVTIYDIDTDAELASGRYTNVVGPEKSSENFNLK